MDTIQTEHEINELKLQSLAREVDQVQQQEGQASGGQSSLNPADADRGTAGSQPASLQPPSSNADISQGTAGTAPPVKLSRSPVDIASQLFSRNKTKSSSSSKNKKKKSTSSGKSTPPAGLSANGVASTVPANVEHLKQEIQETQEREMKLVSSAIGISPEGNALTEDGHDEVLDLADQLLAQLDARDDVVPNQAAPMPPASGLNVASGHATTSTTMNTPLAAPQPINAADANVNASALHAQNSMNVGSALQPASSRQSATSSTSAISAASTSIPPKPPSPSSRSRHSSASSAPKPTGLGAKLKQALSPHRDQQDDAPAFGTSSSSAVGDVNEASPEALAATTGTATSPFSPQTYKNRHALRKEKKKQKEDAMRAEAQAEIEAERANGGTDNRYDAADTERINIESICKSWNLELVEMEPDGHCMYSAIADQLTSKKVALNGETKKDWKSAFSGSHGNGASGEREKWDYNAVRRIAAEYMRNHMDDFLPYLPAEDVEGEGEGLLSPDGYRKHCDNVEHTSEWGSQTELLALSKALQLPIWVIQSRSPVVKLGAEEPYGKKKSPLTVTYHRVQYGLGEHYNSARPLSKESGMVHLG